MNIEKLINQIKLRPEMFVRENYDFINILNFIYGFETAKFIYNLQDEVDKAYNDCFFAFVKNELEKKYSVILKPCTEYGDLICQVHNGSKQQIDEFFELSDIFFQKVKNRNTL